ncbi:hypothetical protein J1614_010833 [Plenodomus biglobosus]|nr:hypothetical protein J1614_010833 [Plenodomus biglobosus]
MSPHFIDQLNGEELLSFEKCWGLSIQEYAQLPSSLPSTMPIHPPVVGERLMKGTCTEELIAAVRIKFAMALENFRQNDRRAPLIRCGRKHCLGERPGVGGIRNDGIDDRGDTAM